jgi:aryl-alcohol dehydrogenase-like predicted oxidoreductase
MKYVSLGRTGVKVSTLCMGTMTFGAQADEAASKELFEACVGAGVNFFDTADMYTGGESERILGRLMKSRRDELVIATKVYFPMGEGVNDRGASRYHTVRACEASLRRLDTDRIDVYYIHRFDEGCDLEEALLGIDLLVRQGKVLYPALSNFAAWQVQKALGVCELRGFVRPACVQPMYNLVKRQAEVEILPQAADSGIGVLPYSPLAAGLLTGKYRNKGASGRIVESAQYSTRYGAGHYAEVAEAFVELADEVGIHPVSLAIAWVGAHPAVTAPIMGARNVAQLEPALASVEVDIAYGDALYERVRALSPDPPPATDRNEERA